MKTPEELAEEYATPRFETYDETKGYQKAQRNAFLAGYQAAAPQWISVKDSNPEPMEMVLVYHRTFGVQMGFINDNHIRPCRNRWIVYIRNNEENAGNHIPRTGKYEYIDIPYWMPLPAAPKEET